MTALALVSGVLYRAPEFRISKAGKPFVTATIRVKDGDTTAWWKVICFSESAQAELMRLGDGDGVSVQGSLRVETYEKNGETKVSFTVVADAVLPLRRARERKPKPATPHDSWAAPDRLRDDRPKADADLNDSIPF